MNCNRFENRLAEYIDSRLPLLEARRVEVHLTHCSVCREEAHLLADVMPALRRARKSPPAWNGWKDLRKRMRETPPPLPAPRLRPRRAGKLMLAAALALTGCLAAAGLVSASARDDSPLAREFSRHNSTISKELGWVPRPNERN